MKKIDTFSAHTLKLLESSPEQFKKRYIDGLHFLENPSLDAKVGKKFHALISYYLKGFEVSKPENALSESELAIWERLKADPILKNDFVLIEHSFLIKEAAFFLTGRFDAVYKGKDGYTVLDWKTKHLPKNPENDLQSVVYLYCASKIFGTENISIVYYSIFSNIKVEVNFASQKAYLERISGITANIPF
jgi:ATP-dependent exoDNAse (exonuclease V) beta subunit